jgi:release factor glutamine methyltransferase
VTAVASSATLGELLREGEAALSAAGIGTARVEAEWLLARVLNTSRFGAYLDLARSLPPSDAAGYRALLARRSAREPLQHLLGHEDFHGLRFAVSPAVLIPRPETEGLVEWALDRLPAEDAAVLADVGTGSGAIACALATARPAIRVLAIDQSSAALEIARDNVDRLDLADRVVLLEGDLLEPVIERGARVDLLVANLPYVPGWSIETLAVEVARHEPRLALDGGPDGMALIRRLVEQAPAALRAGASVLLEIGPGQSVPLAACLEARGFDRVEVRSDLCGVIRYLGARWPGPDGEDH